MPGSCLLTLPLCPLRQAFEESQAKDVKIEPLD